VVELLELSIEQEEKEKEEKEKEQDVLGRAGEAIGWGYER
jgi:hypothetical protein